jgi:hypothetical protein
MHLKPQRDHRLSDLPLTPSQFEMPGAFDPYVHPQERGTKTEVRRASFWRSGPITGDRQRNPCLWRVVLDLPPVKGRFHRIKAI